MADDKKPAAGAKPAAKAGKKSFKAYKPGRSCPKCGSGVRLANHENRLSCGRCGYFEKK